MKKHDQAQTTAEGLQKLICAATGLQPHEVSVVPEMTDEEYNYSGYVRDVLNGGW